MINVVIAFNFLAAVQQRARRDRLATRYFWKWRLLMADRRIECLRATTIAAEVKHQEERQINCEVDAQDEQAKPFEEPGLEPSAQQPDDRSFEVDSQTWQDTLPAGSLSPIDPPKIEATAPPETSPLAESQPSQSPDNPASLRGAIEDAPEPAFVQPQLPEWRKKAKKGPSKFQRAPAGRTSGDDWLANNLAQEEGLTRPQGLSAPSFSSPRPGPWAPKNPKVPKEEQWGAENDASLKPKSRLADMVQGPVKVTKCALDRDCRAPVCGKAHHGPCTDPTTPFMPEKWCWYNQECDRSSCQRWHLSPASADPPAEGSSLEGQW